MYDEWNAWASASKYGWMLLSDLVDHEGKAMHMGVNDTLLFPSLLDYHVELVVLSSKHMKV